jgi:cytochrome c-type biogenesis protein CcmH/NrfG
VENRNILIGMGTGLVAGFVLGYGTGAYFTTGSGVQAPPKAMTAPPSPQVPPMAAQAQVEAVNRITATKDALQRDPSNVEAWIALGNDYFDTHQPQLSVDAYAKALALSPKHPHLADILTDQGVMYREMKAFDKALANFKQANKVAPNHLPCLLNMGVVYATDMHDLPAAKKAWNRILEIDPASIQAEQARKFLSSL